MARFGDPQDQPVQQQGRIGTDPAPTPQAAPPTPPVAAPSIIDRVKGYFANRPSLNDVTDGKMHALGGPEKYVLMGAFGSGVPGAAAGFRAAIPGIAKGASKVGIGAALDSAGVPAHVGTLLGAREGIPDIVSGIKTGITAGRAAAQASSPAARLSRAIEMPAPEARSLPVGIPQVPAGLTGREGILPGPLAPVKPLNIAGPMPPPAEGAIMPQPVQPIPAPRLIDRSRISISRPDAEVLVEEAGGGGIPKNVRDPVRERVQKSNLKENQRALEEFRAREAKRSK